MKTTILHYRIIVEQERQNGKAVYVAHAPSLGLSDFGATIDAAVTNLEQAIKLYLETLVELQEPVPQPDADDYYITTRKIALSTPAKL